MTPGTLPSMTTHERPFGRYLEDFTPGDVLRHWPGKTITEYDDHLFCMITMNHHPLHTNDWFAAESVQGRNVVVGNLVYSLCLGMSVPDVSGAAIANLEVETLQHKFPTFHGDTIHAETRVLEVKESKSKPDRGIVTVETKGFNQDGKEVCYFKRKVLIWKREFGPGPQASVRRRRRLGRLTSIDPGPVLAWGVPRTARSAVASRPRSMADPRRRGDAAADPGATGSIPKWEAFLERVPDTGEGARRHRSATCCGCGRGSAIRAGPATSTQAAAVVVDRDGGAARRLDALLALPGIGPYTARAVLAFAFERDVAVVDTNIARVLARTAGERLTPKRAQAAADELVPSGAGWAWNQVFMDLGATVCRPPPHCADAPSPTRVRGTRRTPDPDPAVGSAGVSAPGTLRRQRSPAPRHRAGRSPPAPSRRRLRRTILDGLVADGLVQRRGDHVALPE